MADEAAPGLIDTSSVEQAEAKVRPDWVPEKFWSAETGGVRTKELAGAYSNAEQLISKRIQELGDEDRTKLFEAARPHFEEPLAKQLREKLAADDEFLAPIREKWAADSKPVVPEAYEIPEALRELAPADDPLTVKVSEWAKEAGVSQEAFNGLLAKFGEGVEAVKAAREAARDEIKASLGPDYAKREKIVLTALLGADADPDIKALVDSVATAEQFRALEKLVARSREKPMPTTERLAVTPDLDTEIANLRNKYRSDPTANKDAINRQLNDLYARKYAGQ